MSMLSGQITITNAGTAVPGPDVEGYYFALKAHPANVGTVWCGNDGNNTVDNTSGFPLDPGEGVEVFTRSLSVYFFNA
ncbi:MAG TPA: hypothetical protein VNK95_25145, partial [Caldilineaceae bacterium]|nr:hypothetical protein [Caldilineaceae bacterium]